MDRRNILRDAEPGLRNMATRIAQAEENFVAILMQQGSLTKPQAEKVFQIYKKLRVIKLDAVNGRYNVKHGGFLDGEIIHRALSKA